MIRINPIPHDITRFLRRLGKRPPRSHRLKLQRNPLHALLLGSLQVLVRRLPKRRDVPTLVGRLHARRLDLDLGFGAFDDDFLALAEAVLAAAAAFFGREPCVRGDGDCDDAFGVALLCEEDDLAGDGFCEEGAAFAAAYCGDAVSAAEFCLGPGAMGGIGRFTAAGAGPGQCGVGAVAGTSWTGRCSPRRGCSKWAAMHPDLDTTSLGDAFTLTVEYACLLLCSNKGMLVIDHAKSRDNFLELESVAQGCEG